MNKYVLKPTKLIINANKNVRNIQKLQDKSFNFEALVI